LTDDPDERSEVWATNGLTSPNLLPHLRLSPQKTHELQRQSPPSPRHVALQAAQQEEAEGVRWSEPQLSASPQSSTPWMPVQPAAVGGGPRAREAVGKER
jgi:hypothetical protein